MTPETITQLSGIGGDLHTRLSRHADDLLSTLRNVVGQLGAGVTPARLTVQTGLNRNSASRLLLALEKRDSLAALHDCPGPEALRKFVAGLRSIGRVDQHHLDLLEIAVERYDHLVHVEFAGKPALDGALSLWLPQVRSKVDTANRNLAYRGRAALRGISIDVEFILAFVLPSQTHPGMCDRLQCGGILGMRRLVPGAPMRLFTISNTPENKSVLKLDGEPMRRRPTDCILPEYSSSPFPQTLDVPMGEKTVASITTEALGVNEAFDMVAAEYVVGALPEIRNTGYRFGIANVIEKPVKELVIDLFVHRDLLPDAVPECLMYDTAGVGAARLNDSQRDIDLVPQSLTPISLGTGIDRIGVPSISRYRELAADACKRRNLRPSEFRGHRLHCMYPEHAGQYGLVYTVK